MPDASILPPRPAASLPATSLGALGVVLGDIGTSPLYIFKTVLDVTGAHPVWPCVDAPVDASGFLTAPAMMTAASETLCLLGLLSFE